MDRTKLSDFFISPWINKARQYFEYIHQFSITVLTDLEVSVTIYVPMASAETQSCSEEHAHISAWTTGKSNLEN